MGKMRRVAIYVRVSTDGQTTTNQQRELEAVVKRHGWEIVEVFKDQGISGKSGREQRPAFDRLLQGVTRKDFDIVAAWSVDRLGRSLQHLLSFLSELKAKGIDLYLHQQGVDERHLRRPLRALKSRQQAASDSRQLPLPLSREA